MWFGLASALSVVVLGDESGYAVTEHQKTKLAAMEGMWTTEEAPAGLTVFGIPDEANRTNHAEVRIPYMLGLIATRSSNTVLPGIDQLEVTLKQRIESGAIAVGAMERLRKNKDDVEATDLFAAHKDDMGYGLLLKRYIEDVTQATPEMVASAVDDAIPPVVPLFWSFRIMVALGLAFIALFAIAFWASAKNTFEQKRWLLRWALWFIPMPWVATQVGWIVAEVGRQPWTVHGVLPTHLSVSSVTANEVMLSLAGFITFYTLLLIAELYLMFKYARLGPSSLGTGGYHFESGGGMTKGAVSAPVSKKEF